ncbi:unnamed protein product [Rotaria sp. Silwood1]|nr:unnamed protein product [Rotaria sp. Silwood1]
MNDLAPMDKPGPMGGQCEIQTYQMETFLKENFDFENIPGEYIVQGVKSFRIGQLPSLQSLDKKLIIKFPSEIYENPFEMTIEEIRQWQQSYVVYACQDNDLSIDKEFLKRALQGQSKDGDEAFRMKFVIRISTCPILMEFDAQVIPRKLEEEWPNRIKLVSVTGIDFAGRKHDIRDIYTYLTNWRNVYALDPHTNEPFIYGGRDFCPNRNVRGVLDEKRLYDDLIRMARLRLRACDYEGVQIVVETGIGLGVFAGRQIGIDHQTRSFTARAIKQVLEEDGSSYSKIKAVVFALPIFEIDESTSTYNYFIDIFKNKYIGIIPILIVDQDMHRLTVAIAKQGFFVSELNPADSHGVFEKMNERLDELQLAVKNKETEVNQLRDLLKNASSNADKLEIIGALTTSNRAIELIRQERVKIIELLKTQIEKGTISLPSKKMRRSLPPPTSGFKWNFDILAAYSINFQLVYTLNELLFQAPPTTSDRAKRFVDACSIISYENLLKVKFPSDPQASWLAKHMYLITSSCFGNMEASIDDMVIVLFNALGFNDGDLITMSRNRLNFQMSNKTVCTDADLTVFNLKSMICLALVKDKRFDKSLGIDKSGESQLIAEAIAAAMYNRKKIITRNNLCRAISEPLTDDPKPLEAAMINTLCISDVSL